MDYLKKLLLENSKFPAITLVRAIELYLLSQDEFEKPILDAGCGTGKFLPLVFDEIELGVDTDPKHIETIKRSKYYKNGICEDLLNLEKYNIKFNSIISNSVLEHSDNIEGVVSTLSNILNTNGKLLITVPLESNNNFLFYPNYLKNTNQEEALKFYNENILARYNHINNHPADWWIRLLEKNNLKIQKVRRYMHPETVSFLDLITNSMKIESRFGEYYDAWKPAGQLLAEIFYPTLKMYYDKEISSEPADQYGNVLILASKK